MMNHPAVALMAKYEDINEGCQTIIPYYLSIMGTHSMLKGKNKAKVKGFITWYLDHLNDEDRWGVQGSVYDYIVCCNGSELSSKQYDSADGYAGQFLILVDAYEKETGDKKTIKRYKDEIYMVADVIIELQDEKDGLDIAMPSYPVKYLMDNCEAYGGLESFCDLAGRMKWDEIDDHILAKNKMKKGILNQLYDKKNEIFFWAYDEDGKHGSSWMVYYPDSLAQIFPILYDVIETDSPLAGKIWKRFKANHNSRKIKSVEQRLLIDMLKAKLKRT